MWVWFVIVNFKMNFKAIVAKIKDEFHDKLKTQNTNELPI